MARVIINGADVDIDRLPQFRPEPAPPEFWAKLKADAERQAEAAKHWPRTLAAAVEHQLAILDEKGRARLLACKQEDLIDFHFSWGLGIRNGYGLYVNDELRASCGETEPDLCSSMIMNAVWTAVQNGR